MVQALGPFGFPMRSSLQYIACMAILQHPWRETCAMAAKPLVIKQGMSSTTAGRGALSAACALPHETLSCLLLRILLLLVLRLRLRLLVLVLLLLLLLLVCVCFFRRRPRTFCAASKSARAAQTRTWRR